jgi:hypothetical protein
MPMLMVMAVMVMGMAMRMAMAFQGVVVRHGASLARYRCKIAV